MEEKCKCPPPGAPGWIVTFADLMSILLTFFILILSFSVQDEKKYYDMVGSIREAFGTQEDLIFAGMVELFGNPYNEFAVTMVPVPIATVSLPDVGEGAGHGDQPVDDETTVGNPLVEREDMPSAPFAEEQEDGNPPMDPESDQMLLVLQPDQRFSEERLFESEAADAETAQQNEQKELANESDLAMTEDGQASNEEQQVAALPTEQFVAGAADIDREAAEQQAALEKRAAEVREKLAAALANELAGNILSIDGNKTEITIRFPDSVAFGSGSDNLKDTISPSIARLADVLADTEGEILVSGHTDSIPISNGRFRSNWDLSTARAVSVIHQLQQSGKIGLGRLAAIGYADTRPLAPDDTAENRALNRRVEVTLRMVEIPPADGGQNTLP